MAGDAGESSLLTTKLRAKLMRIAKEEGFVNPLLRVGEGAKAGDGFISVVFRVYIDEQDESSGKSTLPLVIKSLPRTPPAEQIFTTERFFRKETIFYNIIQPAFTEFQKQHGITKLAPIAPRCFDAKDDIILEDMRPLGFTMKKGNYMMDLAHCMYFIKEIGRMHAVSFAIKDQHPEIYTAVTKDFEEPFVISIPSKIMKDRFDKAVEIAIAEFKKRVTSPRKAEYVEKLEKFLDKDYYKKIIDLMDYRLAEPYNILNHGDCWSNNALFKYDKGDASAPSAICLLDFQVVRNASPVIDVSYLIFIGTAKELRDAHYKELLKAYYDSLSDFMRQLGSDPEKVFPYSVFEDQLKRFARYALALAIHETPVYTYVPEDEPPIVDKTSSVDPAYTLTHANSDTCWSRVCDVILDMMDLGYMN